MQDRRITLLGEDMDAVTRDEVMAMTAAWVAEGRRALVGNHNLHSLHLVKSDPSMRAIYALADVVEIDSMPLIAWGRLLGHRLGREQRNTYLDWRDQFWTLAANQGWRVFHLGCRPGVGETAAARLQARYPGVTIAEADGYFDVGNAENDRIIDRIRGFSPHVLFVGMGMPRQERWIVDNWDRLPACVVFPIGAAFDYEAGVVPTPPRWTAALHLEWFARFLAEPGRLFHRYFVEPWSLVPSALADVVRRLRAGRPRPPAAAAPQTSLTPP